MSRTSLQLAIAWILNLGVVLALLLVMTGGVILLYQDGHQPLDNFLMQASQITINPLNLWQDALLLTPVSLIELGLFVLIGTQVLRIALLALFYIVTHDKWFTLFSIFILAAMISSFFLR